MQHKERKMEVGIRSCLELVLCLFYMSFMLNGPTFHLLQNEYKINPTGLAG